MRKASIAVIMLFLALGFVLAGCQKQAPGGGEKQQPQEKQQQKDIELPPFPEAQPGEEAPAQAQNESEAVTPEEAPQLLSEDEVDIGEVI